jgi:hypothetical protein
MKQIAVCRTISKSLAGLAGRQGRRGGSDHGLQDKSAASGRAHVVDRIADFRHLDHPASWRFRQKLPQFQSDERHTWDPSGEIHP